MADHFNPCRNYAFEDEGGLLIATYPEGTRQPMVAAPYAEEVWTGVEYASASHMIMHGMVEEGLDVVRAVRNRHDGARRNPWNDIECGSYYARSMSAWQLVNAWSGFHADQVDGTIRFEPKATGDYRVFWSAGKAFGELVQPERQAVAARCWAARRTCRELPSMIVYSPESASPPGNCWNSSEWPKSN